MVLAPFKSTWVPNLPQIYLKLSLNLLVYGTTLWMLLCLLMVLLLLMLLWA